MAFRITAEIYPLHFLASLRLTVQPVRIDKDPSKIALIDRQRGV